VKLLRFDSVGGASGDMVLAALLDLGLDAAVIEVRLRALGTEPFTIRAEQVVRGGFRGLQVDVTVHDHHHPHRTLSDIRTMLREAQGGALPTRALELSLCVFSRLAEAEAKVHGVAVDDIHFHEVGAMDSIVDIVASCTGLVLLGVDCVRVGELPLGTGTTRGSHGVLPLPVPAVVELLQGHPVRQTRQTRELVTPTGAALLMTWQKELPDPPDVPWTPQTSGYGLGSRELDGCANLLRATLCQGTDSPCGATQSEICTVLECNLDDTVPELLGSLTLKLLERGALDVFTTAVQMKKQRPGTLLTVLCQPGSEDAFKNIIFTESTTFGIREYGVTRTLLPRRHVEVQTDYGAVRIKIGTWQGRDITRAPEHDDCVRCAAQHGVPVRAVYEEALRRAGA